jgi:hypothetical protein
MLDNRKMAFIDQGNIDFEKEHRGTRAFEIHGGIVLMVLGDTELHGSHDIQVKSKSEKNTRGGFMADVLSLPIGLEVERDQDFSQYDKYKERADVSKLKSLLNIGDQPELFLEASTYLKKYIAGALVDGHVKSELSDLVRAIQTHRHIFIKIPEALISAEQESSYNLFLRRLVQYQLATVVKAFRSCGSRNGGLAYDNSLEPLMDFAEVYNISYDTSSDLDFFLFDYDLSKEEHELQQKDKEVLLIK